MPVPVEGLTSSQQRLLAHMIVVTDQAPAGQSASFVVLSTTPGNWLVHYPLMPGLQVWVKPDDLTALLDRGLVELAFDSGERSVTWVTSEGMRARESLRDALQRHAGAAT